MHSATNARSTSLPRSSQSDSPALRPIQEKVLALLIQGSTVTEAAAATGIHRTTVHHWCRHFPVFADALIQGRASHASKLRDEIQPLAETALTGLRALLESADTPPPIRFRAIQHILGIVSKPEPSERRKSAVEQMYELERWMDRAQCLDRQPPEESAEFNTIHRNSSENTVSSDAESTAAIARSAPCPCNSGKKYKRCCGAGAPPAQHTSAKGHA